MQDMCDVSKSSNALAFVGYLLLRKCMCRVILTEQPSLTQIKRRSMRAKVKHQIKQRRPGP
jgi:hypothetical protein